MNNKNLKFLKASTAVVLAASSVAVGVPAFAQASGFPDVKASQ